MVQERYFKNYQWQYKCQIFNVGTYIYRSHNEDNHIEENKAAFVLKNIGSKAIVGFKGKINKA